jgi:prevent-host-death family protein
MGTYMKAVRSGDEVVVTDRDQPVARLVPYRETEQAPGEDLEVVQAKDPAAPAFSKLVIRPIRYRGPSTTALLEEDRRRR